MSVVSDPVRPHRRQPSRLPFLGFSRQEYGVGCHFLLQYIKEKSESEVAQSCPTLRDPIDCSLPGSSVHGISQVRVLEWVAVALSFKWIYLSFSPLPFTSLLFTAICKASSYNHFAFLHFFILGMVLITASCTMS